MEKIPDRLGMGFEVSFESNIAAWTKGLADFKREQVPFAAAQAVTATARDDVKPAVERAIDIVFDRPTPFTRRAVGYRPAYKRDPVARVFIKDVQASYLGLEVYGGVRTPKRKALVIPAGQRVNQYGNLTRGAVKKLLARKDVFSGTVNGTGGIWQRTRKGGLKLLIAYASEVTYRPTLKFHEVARREAEIAFPKRFGEALARAIATRR